jgi:hypothetical protein
MTDVLVHRFVDGDVAGLLVAQGRRGGCTPQGDLEIAGIRARAA